MFNRKMLIVVSVFLLAVMSVLSWGASFRWKTIAEQQFMYMCTEGDTKGVIEAINSGINVNAKGNYGHTALMRAASHGHTEIANALIKAGAAVNAKDYDGDTALILAALSGNTEIVNALIDAGSYVNEKNNRGKMAVDYARENYKLKGTDALQRLEELSR